MSFRHFKTALSLLGVTVLLLPMTSASSHAAGKNAGIRLPAADAGGETAITALGETIGAVATGAGKTADQLRRMFRRDSSLRVDRNGKLFYKEKMPRLPGNVAQSAGVLDGTLFPLDQTFSLHSKPGSNRLLILNFQGKTITGTYWNTASGRSSIVAPPYDIDRNPGVFSAAERTTIQQIWQRVAEDYAPFDVDVTTDAAARVPAGAQYATAVITANAAFGSTAPGVSYVSTFGNPIYDPSFVAYDTLQNNAKYIAEATSHEFGHRLGLGHDGTPAATYYGGQGVAPLRWAPIMGVSYSANITQFSKGEYANANNTEDDFLLMQRYLAYRPDDAGNTPEQALPLPSALTGSTRSGSFAGIIGRQNDADVFAIQAGAGPLTAAVTPAAGSPDLDAGLTLLDSIGATVLASAPGDRALNAALTFTVVSPGTYFLRVQPTGLGNPQTNGYSTYGSRGNYLLTASYGATAATSPSAVISAGPATAGLAPLSVSFSAAGSSPAGAINSYRWDFGNGATATTATANTTYTTPGRYTARLMVGSNGFSSGTQKEIRVARPYTATLSITRVANANGSFSAVANVTATRDSTGRLLAPSPLVGTWSGGVQGTGELSGMTRRGLNFQSPATRNASSCFTFTLGALSTTTSEPGQSDLYLPSTPISATACPQQASR